MPMKKIDGRIKPSEITPREAYFNRRRFLQAAGISALANPLAQAASLIPSAALDAKKSGYAVADPPTPREKAQSHNNFYELGPQKDQPARNADLYQNRPWQISVEGEVHKPRVYDVDDLLSLAPLEERIYRMRCVEAWSMVIPWIGFPLAELLRQVEPTANAKFVEFVTFHPDDLFPDDTNSSLEWPYVEGLRMDEAMHPLTLLTFGMYGELLPNQNGAPMRIVVPWKYGFKSGKALVKIRLTEEQPLTAWNAAQSSEYGFYSNVNPEVSHPRWSQSTEKAIGASLFPDRRETEMFNGYADEVAHLYAGMDLRKFF